MSPEKAKHELSDGTPYFCCECVKPLESERDELKKALNMQTELYRSKLLQVNELENRLEKQAKHQPSIVAAMNSAAIAETEIDRLKAELDYTLEIGRDVVKDRDNLKEQLRRQNGCCDEKNLWKSRADKMAEALRELADKNHMINDCGDLEHSTHCVRCFAKEALAESETCYTGLIDCKIKGPHHHNENDPPAESEKGGK